MSPSRGQPRRLEARRPESSTSTSTDEQADMRSSSALALARQNISFLLNPSSTKGGGGGAPARLRTRALLRSLHYVGVFLFWRVVRYAKYALVGSVIAAVGSTAVGSGVAFFVAPPTLVASVGVGLIWAVGRWGFRRLGVGERVADGVVRSRERTAEDGSWRTEQGPQAVPW